MKKLAALILICAMLFTCATASGFPEKSINGVIQWGAGGGTDSLMRPLCSLAEKALGVSIVVRNMTGGTGSIATQYVYDQAPDGYTLLLGAENPALYEALDISDITYEDFACVFLIGDETAGVIVNKGSAYETFAQLIADAIANPGKLTLATTGTGGLPWEVAAMITHVTGATFNQIPYDSDASARTAVMSGECVFTICKVQTGIEAYRAGDIKYLSMLSDKPVPAMAEVPLVIDEYPEFIKFLPWGPFYGVFVKRDADAGVVETLSSAFMSAFNEPAYQEVLSNYNINALGYTGAAASEYIEGWRRMTLDALEKSGAIDE